MDTCRQMRGQRRSVFVFRRLVSSFSLKTSLCASKAILSLSMAPRRNAEDQHQWLSSTKENGDSLPLRESPRRRRTALCGSPLIERWMDQIRFDLFCGNGDDEASSNKGLQVQYRLVLLFLLNDMLHVVLFHVSSSCALCLGSLATLLSRTVLSCFGSIGVGICTLLSHEFWEHPCRHFYSLVTCLVLEQ
ncbi:hypothetical protein F2Q70_00001136 [Brassica cretica]|uniref:Uncharacterized protein n=1 Tax=Brassica cretica TaxID=69181 RepID=A0A8S9J3E4_BRACR|nr:hypothetical protein F2Q70_00001136 [Brassica cretica]